MLEKLPTESRNPLSENLDLMETLEIVKLMNEEDAKIPLAVRDSLVDVAKAVDSIVDRLKKGGRVLYVGAGTSGRIGVLDAAEIVPTFGTKEGLFVGIIAGGDEALRRALEFVEDDEEAGKRDLKEQDLKSIDSVIGVSASGRTPYVKGALEYAKEIGALTIAVSNVPRPEICESADICIRVVTGPEILTGSTRLKAGTAQKMILNMISTASMVKLGKVYGNLMVDVKVTNEKLRMRAIRIVSEALGVDSRKAEELLEKTNWRAKVAIVVGVLGVSAEEAERILDASGGHVRRAIESKGSGRQRK